MSNTQSLFKSLLITIVFALMVLPVQSQTSRKTYTVKGQILSSLDGLPMADIKVNLQGTAFFATTNAMGQFAIPGVPVGTYNVIAKYPDFDATVLNGVEVPPSARKSFVFNLDPTDAQKPMPLVDSFVPDYLGTLSGFVNVRIDTFHTAFRDGKLALKAVSVKNALRSFYYPTLWELLPIKDQRFRFEFSLPLQEEYRFYLVWQKETEHYKEEKTVDVVRKDNEQNRVRLFDFKSERRISDIVINVNADRIK